MFSRLVQLISVCVLVFISFQFRPESLSAILRRNRLSLSDHQPKILIKNFIRNISVKWDSCKIEKHQNNTRFETQPDTYDERFDLTQAEANEAARERGSEPLIILVYSKDINKTNPPDFPWRALVAQGQTNKCSSNCVYTLDNRMISCADLVVVIFFNSQPLTLEAHTYGCLIISLLWRKNPIHLELQSTMQKGSQKL